VTGPPFALEPDVMVADGSGRPALNSGAAQFDVSRAGTLVFATGGSYPAEPSRLEWVDRSRRVEVIQTSTGNLSRPRLSPDGHRVAIAMEPASAAERAGIAIVDLERKVMTPLTRSSEWSPLWSTDGSQVFFSQDGGIGRVRADGAAPIERVYDRKAYPHSITPDGAVLLFHLNGADTGADIWTLRLGQAGTESAAQPLLNSAANEAWAEISPDGKWLAYGSDSSGRVEVYVQPFPGPGQRQQVSFGDGDSPLWSRNGRELFFLSGSAQRGMVRLNVVDVTTGSVLKFGPPRFLFEGRIGRTGGPTAYDISHDGSRFLMTEHLDPPKQPVTRLHLVLNRFDELRRAQHLRK